MYGGGGWADGSEHLWFMAGRYGLLRMCIRETRVETVLPRCPTLPSLGGPQKTISGEKSAGVNQITAPRLPAWLPPFYKRERPGIKRAAVFRKAESGNVFIQEKSASVQVTQRQSAQREGGESVLGTKTEKECGGEGRPFC